MVMEAEFCKVLRTLKYYNGANGGKMCSTLNLMEKISKVPACAVHGVQPQTQWKFEVKD